MGGVAASEDGAPHACPAPVPYRLRTPSPARFAARAAEVGAVFSTRLGPTLAKRAAGRSVPAIEVARPLRRACEDLGATFLKYAQLVASSETLFGAEVTDEFRSCLDTGPSVPFSQVEAQLERAAGRPLEQVFAHLDPTPIGQASLAVVHRGNLRDGRDVAVKVLRPGIEGRIASDLTLLRQVLAPVAAAVSGGSGRVYLELIDGLERQLQEELDLRNESRTMDYFRSLPQRASLPLVVVPETHAELSSRRVLVMAYLDGAAIDDHDWVAAAGIDPGPLVEQVVQAWFMTALRGGIFHGDVHAGNILVLTDGRAALLDWGIVGRLEPDAHRMLRALVRGALGDDGAWHEMAESLQAQLGGATDRLGIDAEVLAGMLRSVLGDLMTRPFGEVSLAEAVAAPMRQIEALRAEAGEGRERTGRRPRRPRLGRLPDRRRRAPDVPGPDRGLILLAKQLAYFERYGKLYLADRPLLGDEAFFASVLGAGTLTDP